MEQLTIPAAHVQPGDIIQIGHKGGHYTKGWGLVYKVWNGPVLTRITTGGVGELKSSYHFNNRPIQVKEL